MGRAKGIFQILVAIGLAVGLVVGWDYLSNYYVVLKFIPSGPHIDARVVLVLGAIGILITGVTNLRGAREKIEDPMPVQNKPTN